MTRLRDQFKLYRVDYRNNLNQANVALVWAHTMSDALRVVDELVRTEPHRFVSKVTGIDEIRTPDTDTEDYADVAWVGGAGPVWP